MSLIPGSSELRAASSCASQQVRRLHALQKPTCGRCIDIETSDAGSRSLCFSGFWFPLVPGSSGFRPGFTPPCLVLESVFPRRQKPPCDKLTCQFQIVCCRASYLVAPSIERYCALFQATRGCEPGPSRNKVLGIAARPLQQDVSSISRGGERGRMPPRGGCG